MVAKNLAFHHGWDAFVPATNDKAQTHTKGIWLVASPGVVKDCTILEGSHLDVQIFPVIHRSWIHMTHYAAS